MARRSRKYRTRLLRPYRYNLWNGGKRTSTCAKGSATERQNIFRENNKEADLWAGYGAKGISMEWVDESAIDWIQSNRDVLILGWELQ